MPTFAREAPPLRSCLPLRRNYLHLNSQRRWRIKKRIQTLDGLRGVAIGMVLLSHSEETRADGYTGLLTPLHWFSQGTDGVTIFFVLSGYLITSILVREYDTIGKLDIKAFYCRRILRIFPAFYTFLICIALLDWRGAIDLSRSYIALSAAHLVNYAHALFLVMHAPDPAGPGYWYIAHFWSLSMEEQFYWMWPVTLLLLLRKRWYGLLVGVILAMPVIRLASYFLFPGLRGQLMMMLHSGSDAIFTGCLLAILMARHPDFCRRLLAPAWVIALLAIYFFRIEPILTPLIRGYVLVVGQVLMEGIVAVVMANLLLREGETWYSRVLGWTPLVWLGRISYSVYLWQQLFLTKMNTTPLGIWPFNLVVAILVGWFSYRCIELPFIWLKDKYFLAHTKRVAPGADVAGETART